VVTGTVGVGLWIAIAVIAVLLVAALVVGLVRYRRRRISLSSADTATPVDRSGGYTASSGITFTKSAPAEPVERIDTSGLPAVGDDATIPRDAPKRPIADVQLPQPPLVEAEVEAPAAPQDVEEAPAAPDVGAIAPTEGRLDRLRGRLAKSQNTLGRGMLGLLGGGDLDEESWEAVEDILLIADLGPVVTESVVSSLRLRMASSRVRTEIDARAVLREVLIEQLQPDLDRSIKALPHDNKPSVLLVVGVNGTGKTTTVGKLARVLVADGRRVVLGAADTFRAAAAHQLETWASRVGAQVVSGAEGADPASVAFDAVDRGIESGADVVVIDTAGRLHTKTGLMDELGKVKRVVSRRAEVDEVLLVLDATIGQNGLPQARVFAEVVDITGVVLTKLDGTAKGGIVFRVQQELGVPVKLVGLGEGPDDLAPFEPAAFVDALLG
jgi:fused signal recognition particle receptor